MNGWMIQVLSVGAGDLAALRHFGWQVAPHDGVGLVTCALWAPERAALIDRLAQAVADDGSYAALQACGNLTAGGLVLVRGSVIRPGVVSGVSLGDSAEAEAVRRHLMAPSAARGEPWRTGMIHALCALADAYHPAPPASLADALFA